MTAPGGSGGISLRCWVDSAAPAAVPTPEPPQIGAEPWAAGGDGVSLRDWVDVGDLLGRLPQAGFRVWRRHDDGSPRVIRNDPFLADGTPMPTRYWLVSADDRLAVSRLESGGGVRAAEVAVDADDLSAAHARYAAERDGALPADHAGPTPSGGVGGTRAGVKCLHAHYAWHLAGGTDPVGVWVAAELDSGAPAGVTGAYVAPPAPAD